MPTSVESNPVPQEVMHRFRQRLATLRGLEPRDPTRARTAQSFASEFERYPDLQQQILTVASDEIRGSISSNATLNGVVRR